MQVTVVEAIRGIMGDRDWSEPARIRRWLEARGVYCTSYMERLRELRAELRRSGEGDIIKRSKPGRPKGSRVVEYRMVLKQQ